MQKLGMWSSFFQSFLVCRIESTRFWVRAQQTTAESSVCLIPLGPHVVGDALAHLVAVVKPRRTRSPWLPAGQPVTARSEKE